LDAYDNDSEQVIAHLLDGNLPPALAGLDTKMAERPRPPAETKLGVKDKGKAKVVDEPLEVSGSLQKGETSSRVTGIIAGSSGLGAAGPSSSAAPEVKRLSTDQTGRYVRRDRTEADAVKLLDAREKGNERLRSLATEYEYEDEYDDSFDDLMTSAADADDDEGLDGAIAKVRGGQRGTVTATGWEEQRGIPTPPNRGANPPGFGGGKRGSKTGAPQFYVKDGKNYSYKVAGSVAVDSLEEAAAMKVQEEALIHGLGAGGNVPSANVGKPPARTDEEESGSKEEDDNGGGGRGGFRGGRGGGGRGSFARKEQNKGSIANHRRKDRATSKFIKSVGGF
jgi:activating signal cointegrator complex subunit 2